MNNGERRAEDVRVCRPEDALQREARDLVVENGVELQLAAEQGNAREYYAWVQARSVADLQVLGLVPRGLSEDDIRKAVADDDRAAYQTAREIAAQNGSHHECSCQNANGATAYEGSYSQTLGRAYANVRRTSNPALANLLSDHQHTQLRWDSIHVQSVKGWLDRLSQRVSDTPLVIGLFQDIRIGRHSRLEIDPQSVVLFARNIYIDPTGTLAHAGGYLNIWARSIVRSFDVTISAKDAGKAPWLLNS